MPVSLVKGGSASLSRAAVNLQRILIGLGWDARETPGVDFDLDASLFMLGSNGRVLSDAHFVFYSQLKSPCGSVQHTGDNRSGRGAGDDEAIEVTLPHVPVTVERLVVTVSIYDADTRRQNFGMVQNAYIRIVNLENQVELVRFDLSEDYGRETAMIFGEVYRAQGEWRFKAVGTGQRGGLEALCRQFGVDVV